MYSSVTLLAFSVCVTTIIFNMTNSEPLGRTQSENNDRRKTYDQLFNINFFESASSNHRQSTKSKSSTLLSSLLNFLTSLAYLRGQEQLIYLRMTDTCLLGVEEQTYKGIHGELYCKTAKSCGHRSRIMFKNDEKSYIFLIFT